MESKFGIFLIFVTLAQSFWVAESALYGLSAEDEAIFKQIIANQGASLQAKYDAFDPIFYIINSLASEITFDQQPRNNDTASIVETALVRVKEAVDYSVKAIVLSQVCSAAAVETATSQTHADLEHLYKIVPEALALVTAGAYSESQSTFDEIQNAAHQDMVNVVNGIFGLIANCLDDTDADAPAIVETVASKSKVVLISGIDSVFNAIRLYAAALANGSADTSLISEITNLQRNARTILRTDIELEFGLFTSMFLKSKLNLDIATSALHSIQYAQVVSTYRFEAGNEALLGKSQYDLKSFVLGLSDIGRPEFSSTDLAKAATTAYVKAAFSILVDSVAETDSTASDVLSTFREYFDDYTEAKVAKLYSTSDMIQEGDTLSDVLAAIDAQEEEYELDGSAADHVAKISDLILNGKQYGDDVRAKISSIQAEEIDALHNYATVFYNLARATARTRFDTEGESEAYPAVIAATRDALFDAIRLFTHKIAELRIIVNSAETLQSSNPIHMLVRTLPLWF